MKTINCGGKLFCLNSPKIMGVLNISPESFYQSSICHNLDTLLYTCNKMIQEGADIIDIGAQSTKPNSALLSDDEEWKRLLPFMDTIIKTFPNQLFSIDTFYSEVVKNAFDCGIHIINDISGGSMDKKMLQTVAQTKLPYIATHIIGTPQTMQQSIIKEDFFKTIIKYFDSLINQCNNLGINDIVLDVGFGFGKSITQNFELLKNLAIFANFEKPILVGLSRKSFIYNTLQTSPEEALNGTTALNMIALYNGANILRVHDVKAAKECIKLCQYFI